MKYDSGEVMKCWMCNTSFNSKKQIEGYAKGSTIKITCPECKSLLKTIKGKNGYAENECGDMFA